MSETKRWQVQVRRQDATWITIGRRARHDEPVKPYTFETSDEAEALCRMYPDEYRLGRTRVVEVVEVVEVGP